MDKKLFLIVFNLLLLQAMAQNFNPKTLTLPEDLTARDFSFLKEELKDVQVVLLGERTHFDGNVFEAKTEIIKFLHQELGFNTVAFESGVYDVWKAQKEIGSGESTTTALEKSLFPIWSKAKEFQGFIEFFDRNKTVLKVIGFDNQITGAYGENQLIEDLFQYCSRNQLTLKLDRDDLELLLESINNSGIFDEEDIPYEKYRSSLGNLLDGIDKKPKEEIHFYWKQIVKNLLSIGKDSHSDKEAIVSPFSVTSDDNIRDSQMADNLLSYIRAHPGEKIICWGANAHFVNDMSSIEVPVLKEFIPMGSLLKEELREKMYSLASITAADSIYLNRVWNKTPVRQGSLEQFLKDKNKSHIFISSIQEEMKKPQLNRSFSPVDFVEARLDLLHDGYLFFRDVRQSTFIDKEDSSKNESVPLKKPNTEATWKTDAPENKSNAEENVLDEVVILSYSKKFTYSVISKAIENIKKNYPAHSFNSTQGTNIDVRVQNESVANLDFTASQYDRGYDQSDRNSKQLKEVRWNHKEDRFPKGIREFWSLSYNNPIMYARYLNGRKSKKFIYRINEIRSYNGKKVYVVDFSIPRKHFTYTHRSSPSNFSGTLYINQDDFAIVKAIENWEFMEEGDIPSPDAYGWLDTYAKKKIEAETIETNFGKVNGLYYLLNSEVEISGNLHSHNGTSSPLKINLSSIWSNFKGENLNRISYRGEQNLFEKIAFNDEFWEGTIQKK